MDAGGSIVHASRQLQASLGYDSAELVGQPVAVLVPEAVRAAHEHHVRWYAKDPHSREMGTGLGLNARRKDGSKYPVEISLTPVDGGGETLYAATVRNISERRKHETDLAEREARYQVLLKTSANRALLLDAQGSITDRSPSGDDVPDLASIVARRDQAALESAIVEVWGCATGSVTLDLEICLPRVGWRNFEVTLTNMLTVPAVGGIVVKGHDVTERRQLEGDLRRRASYDELTGLPNRRQVGERLEVAVSRARRKHLVLAVLFRRPGPLQTRQRHAGT